LKKATLPESDELEEEEEEPSTTIEDKHKFIIPVGVDDEEDIEDNKVMDNRDTKFNPTSTTTLPIISPTTSSTTFLTHVIQPIDMKKLPQIPETTSTNT
jgi:hypothetical protein